MMIFGGKFVVLTMKKERSLMVISTDKTKKVKNNINR